MEVLDAGRLAWGRLQARERASWSDWIAVGHAITIGRTAALNAAGTNQPVGSKYNRLMAKWLIENGFNEVSTQERHKLGLVIQNLPAIEKWREGLTEAQRRKLNSPGAIWTRFRRETTAKITTTSSKPATSRATVCETDADVEHAELRQRIAALAETARQGRAVFWPQEHLRRAYTAMLQSKSTDFMILARLAVQAAIRCEGDLLALLPDAAQDLPAQHCTQPSQSAADAKACMATRTSWHQGPNP